MKKLIMTGVGLLFAATMTFAQQSDAETKTKAKVAVLTEKLTLNEEQQAAIYPIIFEKHQAKVTLKADTTLSQEEIKQRLEQSGADAHSKILDLLNEEQKAIYHQHLDKSKKKDK